MKPLKIIRWFNGSFTCKKCNKPFKTMSFGFGEAICPDCYQGEQPFLFFDQNYLLNRIVTRLNHIHQTLKHATAQDLNMS